MRMDLQDSIYAKNQTNNRRTDALAGGLLTWKFAPDGTGLAGSRRSKFDFPLVDKERAFRCLDVMRPIAERHNGSLARIALAPLFLPKTSLPEHLQAKFLISAEGVVLGDEDQFVGDGLPDNQAIKGVFVGQARQVVKCRCIGLGNW